MSPSEIARGVAATFHAVGKDGDDGPARLVFSWGLAKVASLADCPDGDALPAVTPMLSGAAVDFTVTLAVSGSYCVWVTASDPHGATATATHGFDLPDRRPTAVISRVLPAGTTGITSMPLYSRMRYSSAGSGDPDVNDQVTLVWHLERPSDSAGASLACVPASTPVTGQAPDVCFELDVPGDYRLLLTVTDGDGMAATYEERLHANDDRPPCIVQTDPPFGSQLSWFPDSSHTFRVTALDDDGDPVPSPATQPSMAHFAWSWRIGTTGPFSRVLAGPQDTDPRLAQYSFPIGASEPVGEIIQVRVEAQDRIVRDPPDPGDCQLDQVVCKIGECRRWVTWNVLIH